MVWYTMVHTMAYFRRGAVWNGRRAIWDHRHTCIHHMLLAASTNPGHYRSTLPWRSFRIVLQIITTILFTTFTRREFDWLIIRQSPLSTLLYNTYLHVVWSFTLMYSTYAQKEILNGSGRPQQTLMLSENHLQSLKALSCVSYQIPRFYIENFRNTV